MNFLRSLFNPQSSPSMPFNPASAPPMTPAVSGNLQRMTQGAPENSRVAEIMQAIGGNPDTPPVQMQQQPQQSSQRPRRSFLDTVGQISDVLARVGGAEALYQPTLDAREDRQKQTDLEEMQNRLREQQLQIGEQTLEANRGELAGSQRETLGQALGAIASNPDAAAMWPQIAAQAGIDEQTAQAVGQIIQQNPQAAGVLAQSLGWSPAPTGQGSQAKELQVYGMLQQADPELAQAYLQSIANPDGMSEYQRAQLDLGMARLGLQRDALDQRQARDERKDSAGAAEAGDSNSVASILTDFGVVLDGPEDPIADMIQQSTNGWVQYGAAMIPGAFGQSTEGMEQIAKLQTIDNALILALAGGKLGAGVSNADRSFFEKMAGRISDPTIPADQRLAAWQQIKTRFRGVVQRETKKPAAPARRSGSGQRIMPRTPAGQRPTAQRNPAVEAELRRRGLID